MSLSFRKFTNGIRLVPVTTSTVSEAGDLDFDTTGNKLNLHNGTSASPVVTETQASQGSNRLRNKDLEAGSVDFVDGTDTTKKAEVQLSGATTATSTTMAFAQTANRTVTFPDATTTIVGTDAIQAITAKTLLEVDNIRIDGNTISSLDSNGNINLSPNGTGNVLVDLVSINDNTITGDSASALTIQSASNQDLSLQAQGTGLVIAEQVSFTTNTVSTTQTNQNLILNPNGTGLVEISKTLIPTTAGALSLGSPSSDFNGIYGRSHIITNTSSATIGAIQEGAIPSATTTEVKFRANSETGTIAMHSVSSNTADANATGQARIETGNKTAGTGNSGSIVLQTGTSSGGVRGRVEANGLTFRLNSTAAADPSGLTADIYYNTGSNRFRYYNGTVWADLGSGGKYVTSANQNISAAGTITISNNDGFQMVRVTGNGAAVSASATPFGSVVPEDGTVVTIIGQSNTNTVQLTNNDASKGCLLNGNIVLGAFDSISLMYDATADRYIELSRNI